MPKKLTLAALLLAATIAPPVSAASIWGEIFIFLFGSGGCPGGACHSDPKPIDPPKLDIEADVNSGGGCPGGRPECQNQ